MVVERGGDDDIEERGRLGQNPSFTLDCLQRGPSVHRVPSARPLVRLHIGAIVHNCPELSTIVHSFHTIVNMLINSLHQC